MSRYTITSFNVLFWTNLALIVAAAVTGCTASVRLDSTRSSGIIAATDVVEQAAAQATAIIQQARATALVLQAQSEATALLVQARTAVPTQANPSGTASPTKEYVNVQSIGYPTTVRTNPGYPASGAPETTPLSTPGFTLEVQRVTYGAEGAYIVVYFTATPEVAQKIWPDVLSVIDEGSGAVYNEVPVMPIIGPLIGRPRELGQPGYFMLVNAPVPLQPGSLVTVVIADARFEHIPIQ
jgi:hypothetical protein